MKSERADDVQESCFDALPAQVYHMVVLTSGKCVKTFAILSGVSIISEFFLASGEDTL